MSIVTHVVIGSAVGSFMPNGLSGAAAGFISHILSDLIPHYDPPLVRKRKRPVYIDLWYYFLLLIDFSLGLVVLYLVKDYPNMFWGGLVGGLVDLDAFFIHGLEKIGIMIHDEKSDWHKQTTLFKGLFNQGILTMVGVVLIFARTPSLLSWIKI